MSSLPLIMDEDPYFEPTEISLPEGVLVATMEFPEVRLDNLHEIFDGHFHEIAQAGPIGPGFAIYRGDVSDEFDLTIGFPIGAPADVEGVDTSIFPTGRAVIMSHLGGFDGLGSAWENLTEKHFAAGGEAPLAMIEIYVTDPSVVAHDDLRTDLILVLAP